MDSLIQPSHCVVSRTFIHRESTESITAKFHCLVLWLIDYIFLKSNVLTWWLNSQSRHIPGCRELEDTSSNVPFTVARITSFRKHKDGCQWFERTQFICYLLLFDLTVASLPQITKITVYSSSYHSRLNPGSMCGMSACVRILHQRDNIRATEW